MNNELIFDEQLIEKFDVAGPRYTSYPTADRFSADFGEQDYIASLRQRAAGGIAKPLSLYVHIPFCATLCFYCGCNKIVTKDKRRATQYIRYLEKEMQLQSGYLQGMHTVEQMHWGGGTPNFLSDEEIRYLMGAIRSSFKLKSGGEYSVEIDPRNISPRTIAIMAEEGFNRISLGIQDFDPAVQRAINRIQSFAETKQAMDAARANGFRSINTDLIYGLPFQTLASFRRTLDQLSALMPDRIALYSYAHLPARFPAQRRIHDASLPAPAEKLGLLAAAIEYLQSNGYIYIGMDHFARPDDELAQAQRQGRLQRNFQGYSTHAQTELLAFGVSAIAHVGGVYSQNAYDIDQYYALLDEGKLPVCRGWRLSVDDMVRHAIIQALMCHFELSMSAIEEIFALDFQTAFRNEIEEIKNLHQAGLLNFENDWITITPAGRLLVRAVTMVFDKYLQVERRQGQPTRYSRIV